MKAAYWITSALITAAGLCLMGLGRNHVIAKTNTERKSETVTFGVPNSVSADLNGTSVSLEIVGSTDADGATVMMKDVPATVKVEMQDNVLIITDVRVEGSHFINAPLTAEDEGTITVTIPQEPMDTIDVTLDTGSLAARGIQANTIGLKTDTGTLDAEALEATNIDLTTDTGAISTMRLTAEYLNIVSDTGRISSQYDGSMASTISTDTGAITLDSHAAVELNVQSQSGGLTINETNVSDTVDIHTDTGFVKVTDSDMRSAVNFETDTGRLTFASCRFDGSTSIISDTGSIELNASLGDETYLSTDTGRVTLHLIGAESEYRIEQDETTIGSGSRFVSVDAGHDAEITFSQN